MPEPLYLVNNTFVSNPEAVSGGGNTIALNNVFVGNDIATTFGWRKPAHARQVSIPHLATGVGVHRDDVVLALDEHLPLGE